jgi:hypothetical protein
VVSGVRVAALTAALAVQAVMVRGRTGVHLRAVAKTGEGLAGFSDAGVCLIDAWSCWTWGRKLCPPGRRRTQSVPRYWIAGKVSLDQACT